MSWVPRRRQACSCETEASGTQEAMLTFLCSQGCRPIFDVHVLCEIHETAPWLGGPGEGRWSCGRRRVLFRPLWDLFLKIHENKPKMFMVCYITHHLVQWTAM